MQWKGLNMDYEYIYIYSRNTHTYISLVNTETPYRNYPIIILPTRGNRSLVVCVEGEVFTTHLTVDSTFQPMGPTCLPLSLHTPYYPITLGALNQIRRSSRMCNPYNWSCKLWPKYDFIPWLRFRELPANRMTPTQYRCSSRSSHKQDSPLDAHLIRKKGSVVGLSKGPSIIQALLSTYVGRAWGGLKLLEGLCYLGPYLVSTNLDKDKSGLNTVKKKIIFFSFFYTSKCMPDQLRNTEPK